MQAQDALSLQASSTSQLRTWNAHRRHHILTLRWVVARAKAGEQWSSATNDETL